MKSRKAAYSWFVGSLLALLLSSGTASAQTFARRTISFETDCAGAATAGTFDAFGYKQVSSGLFASCGVSSITSGGTVGTQQLHNPTGADVSGQTGDVVLAGALSTGGGLSFGDVVILFSPEVNELSFDVLDLNNAAGLTISLQAAGGAAIPVTQPTVTSGTARFEKSSATPIQKATISYTQSGIFDGWFIDQLAFNAWKCGDGETEPDHKTDSGRNEACDDGDTINCDGTCGNDCQLSIIDGCCTAATLAGCLDDTNCVADNTDKPGSGGCATCDLALRTGAVDVGFDALESNTASCSDGLNCTLTDTCDGAGKCIGTAKTCAADSLSCTTDACSETAGGACVQTVTKGCVIDDSCVGAGVINDKNGCEVCDPSNSETGWTTRTSGTCGDPSCMDGELTPAATCNASGTCVQPPKVSCDGAVCADAISCTGECQTDEDCQSENHCEAGKCVPDGKPGDPCTRPGECSTNFCVDGVCCDGECEGACKACNIAGSVGMCTEHEIGTDPENKCPDPQVCGPDGTCEPAPNGSECDKNEVCGSGHCADGFCCDQVCNGVCEACNIMGAFGTCTFETVGTNPDNECGGGDAVCSGAGECVSYETRGNGLCTVDFARRSAPWLASLLGLIGLAFASRRRRGA